MLLGVRAVIAESYERIHRSNLVGMGVLPLQFLPGESAASLGLTGRESFTIHGLGRGPVAEAADRRRRHRTTAARRAAVRGDRPPRRPDRRRLLPNRAGSCRRSSAASRPRADRATAEVDVATPAAAEAGPRSPGERGTDPDRPPAPRPTAAATGRRLWDDLGRGGRPGRRRRRGAAPPRPRRAARRRPRPRRGRPGHRQDAARAGGRPGPRPPDDPDPGHAGPPARSTSPARASSRAAGSGSRRARSSRTSSSSTRSTGRRRGPSRRCSRRCRSARSRSRARPVRCPTRSSSSRPRTRSSSRARSRCPRPSSTGSWSGSGSATRTRPASGAIARRYQRRGRAARRDRAGRRRRRGCSRCATRSGAVRVADEVEAYARRDRPGDAAHTRTSSSGASPRATVALYRAAQAAALLDGRSFVLPDDVKAIAPAGPRPTGSSSTSTGACAARPRRGRVLAGDPRLASPGAAGRRRR